MLPLKFLEVLAYFLATRQLARSQADVMALFVKLVGLGVTAFIFDLTRDKLLQMALVSHRMYDWFLWARGWTRMRRSSRSGNVCCNCGETPGCSSRGAPEEFLRAG